MESLTASVLFVDSDTGRQYTVRLVKEDAPADDASHRYVVGPVGWRDGRPPFTFSDVEGDPHGEARHVGNLFNLRREIIDGDSWIVADLDWDSDELALEAKRLVDEDRITGVSIHPSDGDAFLLCGQPPKGATVEQIQNMAAQFDPETCDAGDWTEAWANLIIGSATLLMLPAFENAEVVVASMEGAVSALDEAIELHEGHMDGTVPTSDESQQELMDLLVKARDELKMDMPEQAVTAGGRGEATDDEPWDAGEAMRKAGASDDPAAAFRAIAIETTRGEPSQRQHWALPHHRTPGAPANAAAIRNARARFGQTRNLKDQGAARAHLFEVHKLPSEVEEGASVGEIMGDLIDKVPVASEGLETTPFSLTVDSDGKPWAVVAADIHRPPADWFTDPQLDGPTPLTIDDDGRVFGHLALWSTCHRGFDSQCVTPPKDSTEYAEFHDNARVMLDNGELIGVGCLTFDVSHADVHASAETAKRHYDHSGTVAAFVRAGQDEWGVWVAGAERPGLSKDQRELMRRLSLSGDWRPKNGQYHLIAAQAVPVPGFPIRARVASGQVVELTTRGPINEPEPPSDLALVADGLGLVAVKQERFEAKLDAILNWIADQEQQKAYEHALAVFGELTPTVTEIV